MTMCEYYDALGIYKPECHRKDSQKVNTFEYNNHIEDNLHQNTFHQSAFPQNTFHQNFENNFNQHQNLPKFSFSRYNNFEKSTEAASELISKFAEHPLCTGFFHGCYDSQQCESGTICSQTFSTKECCTAPNSQCPSPATFGFNCRKANPTSWCLSDSHCNSPRSQNRMICCPSGCDYNICVHPSHHLPLQPALKVETIYRTAKLLSPDCPDPLSIPMKCEKHNPTDWCHSHADCPSSPQALNPRRCCFTPCGYKACFIKFGGIWVIG